MEARLAAAVASQDASALSLLQKDLLSDRTSCDAATAGLLFLKDQLRALPAAFNDWVIAVSEEVVAALRPRIVEFENADYHFRYLIWSCAWGSGDYEKGARVLSGALLNSSGVQLTTAQRAANWLKVAQAYLKADNAASCESSLKATNEHLRALPPGAEPGLRVQYGVAVAQNTDFMKNFLQAAMRYNEAALQAAGFGFPPAEVTQLFESATRCVLLAEPGPQRRRVMNHIASEGLIGGVAPLYLTMLDKMKRERLISTGDAAKFEMLLPQHCRALNSEGLSLFADCVMKHNVIAASRVYSSVSFEALGALLGIPGDAARRLVARLVMEKRLSARLDQVAGFVDFAPPTVSQETATLLNMNAAIADACGALNDLVRDTAGI